MSFTDNLRSTINQGQWNESVTENGALGFRTSGKELVDINFNVASMRNWDVNQIIDKWEKTFFEDKLLAVTWLFFASDVRGGLGERRLFRIIYTWLCNNQTDIALAVAKLVPEYSRWDNLVYMIDTKIERDVIQIIENQLNQDMVDMQDKKSISLLAKWMPSIVASSPNTKRLGRKISKSLGCTEREYRKMLSAMRAYLDVLEVKASANRWNEVDYNKVPSKANLKYKDAFMKHDEDRRLSYLESLKKGEAKINAGVLFPHDVVAKYFNNAGWYTRLGDYDETVEQLWKNLPDYVNGAGNTIVVADGSGSMTTQVSPGVSALCVADALAIYFAEHSTGEFKDKYITFSENPQIVDFGQARSLRDKIGIACSNNEVANTNIEAVFQLILDTAIRKHLDQRELPQNILIISDMEFDSCARFGRYSLNSRISHFNRGYSIDRKDQKKLFEMIALEYAKHGYKLPRLAFWNVNSRTGTIPVIENDLGVALVSGFSSTIAKMVLSNKTDPFEVVVEQLMAERYAPVREAVSSVIR